MSDFPFSIPRRGDADVVNGVSYAGTTLTLTRAEGSDLTTTIATSDPTKIENGNSKMEIATSNGACVFTPNGDAALTTTFAADGNITAGATVFIPHGIVTTDIDNRLSHIKASATHFDQSLRIKRDSGDYREYEIGILGDNTSANNVLAFGVHGGGIPDPNIVMAMDSGGNMEITGDLYTNGNVTVNQSIRGDGEVNVYGNTGSTNSFGWLELRETFTSLGGAKLQFYSNSSGTSLGSKRMTILSSGYVGINDTNPSLFRSIRRGRQYYSNRHYHRRQ